MENTVCDFWRMIWEQHLEIVLMLTNLEEYSKTKCAKYWPDKEEEKKTFADITIHYVNEKRFSGKISVISPFQFRWISIKGDFRFLSGRLRG